MIEDRSKLNELMYILYDNDWNKRNRYNLE